MKEILRVEDGKTFMVDEPVCSQNVESQLVRVRSALAIPFLSDGGGVAIGVEQESLSGRGEHIAKDFAADFGGNAQ